MAIIFGSSAANGWPSSGFLRHQLIISQSGMTRANLFLEFRIGFRMGVGGIGMALRTDHTITTQRWTGPQLPALFDAVHELLVASVQYRPW